MFYACNFIKRRLQHRCFPVKFGKFFKKLFLSNISDAWLWTKTLSWPYWKYKIILDLVNYQSNEGHCFSQMLGRCILLVKFNLRIQYRILVNQWIAITCKYAETAIYRCSSNRCSEKICNIYSKAPVLESLLNKGLWQNKWENKNTYYWRKTSSFSKKKNIHKFTANI